MVRPFRHRLAKAFFAVQLVRLLALAGGPATASQHAESGNPMLAETAAGVDDWEREHQDAEPSADALTAEARHGAEISGPSPGEDPYSDVSAGRAGRLVQAIDAKEGPEGKLHDAERRLVASQALEERLAGDPAATEDERRDAHRDTMAAQKDLVSLRNAVEMAPARRLERATAAYAAAVAAEHTTALDPHSTESECAEARMRRVDANHDLVNARAGWESADFNQRAILHESELAVDWARSHGLATAPDIFRDQAVFDLVQTEPASLTDPPGSEMSRERGPFGGETSRPAAIDETLRPIVIGEDQRRVDYAATMFDAEPYDGLSAEQAGERKGSVELERARLAHNETWLRKTMSEGRLVIDTGPAEPKVDYPQPTQGAHGRPLTPERTYRESSAYEMERRITAGYEHTIHPWEDMSRVPWRDRQGQLNVRTLDDTTREQLSALGIDPNAVRERPWSFTGDDGPVPARDPAPPDAPSPSPPPPPGPPPPEGSALDRELETPSPATHTETDRSEQPTATARGTQGQQEEAEAKQEETKTQQEQSARAETQHEQAAKTQQEEAARATAQHEQAAKTQHEQAAKTQQEQAAEAQQAQAKAQQEQAKTQQEQATEAKQEQAAKARQEGAKAQQEQATRAETQHEQAAKTQQEETKVQQARAQQEQAAKAQHEQSAKEQQTQAKAQQEQAAKARAQQEQAAKAQQEQAKAQQEQAAKTQQAQAKAQQEQAAKARTQQQQAAKDQQEQAARARAQQQQAAKAQAQAKAQQEQVAKAKTQQEQAAKAQAQQKQAATKAKDQQEQAAEQKQQAQKGHRAGQQRDSARRGAQQRRQTQPAAKPPEKRPSGPQAGRQK